MSCGLEFFSTEVSAAPPKVIAHVPPNELYTHTDTTQLWVHTFREPWEAQVQYISVWHHVANVEKWVAMLGLYVCNFYFSADKLLMGQS
jgi:hypothetical protein